MRRLILLHCLLWLVSAHCSGQEVVIPFGHARDITHGRLSATNRFLVTWDEYDVFVWDLKRNQLFRQFAGVMPTHAAISVNDSIIAIGSRSTVQLYRLSGTEPFREIKRLGGALTGIDFHTDNQHFALTCYESAVLLYDVADSNFEQKLQDPANFYLEQPGFSGAFVMAQSNNSRVVVWNWNTGTVVMDTCICDAMKLRKALATFGFNPTGLKNRNDVSTVVTMADTAVRTKEILSAAVDANQSRGKIIFYGKRIEGLQFSSDASFSQRFRTRVILYDHPTGKTLLDTALDHTIADVLFTNDPNETIWLSRKSIFRLNLRQKKITELCRSNTDRLRNAELTDNKRILVLETQQNKLKFFQVARGQMIGQLSGIRSASQKEAINFSSDSALRYLCFNIRFTDTLQVVDLTQSKLLQHFAVEGGGSDIFSASFAHNGEWIATGMRDGCTRVWDWKKKRLVFETCNKAGYVDRIAFSPDDRYVVSIQYSGAFAWEIESGKPLSDSTARLLARSLADPYEGFFASSGDKGFAQLYAYREEAGKKVFDEVRLFTFGNDEYLFQLNNRYFMGSRNAAKNLSYRVGTSLLGVNQFDARFNRPDVVLDALGTFIKAKDTALIRSYRRAYLKRIQKLGLDTSIEQGALQLPELEILNETSLPDEKGRDRHIHIRATDRSFALSRLNVWVNEVPVFGSKGLILPASSSVDTAITLRLSRGSNRIEISVVNRSGAESLRQPLQLVFDSTWQSPSRVLLLGIGIDQFKQPLYNLRWSVKDIRDLCSALRKAYGKRLLVDTVFNQQVGRGMVARLRSQLQQLDVDDQVILAYSGHGLLSKNYDYYLSTYEVNFENPEAGGLAYETLEGLLDSIPARRKLMLLDACHSGEIDKEEIETSNAAIATKGSKGVILKKRSSGKQKNQSISELSNSLFINVGLNTGATVLSASAGNQFALERSDLQNGLFTYALLETFRSKTHLSLNKLIARLMKRVPELSNGQQIPTVRVENKSFDWQVW